MEQLQKIIFPNYHIFCSCSHGWSATKKKLRGGATTPWLHIKSDRDHPDGTWVGATTLGSCWVADHPPIGTISF